MRRWILVLAVVAVAAVAFVLRVPLVAALPAWLSASISAPATAPDTPSKQAACRHGGGKVTVTVATAKAGALPILRQTIGAIVPIASTALGSPVAGIVTEVLIKDGAEVKAGDLLVRLDDRSISATLTRDQAALSRDQATLNNARTTQQRVQTLVQEGAGNKQQVDDAIAAAKVAEAVIAVDQADLAADTVLLSQTQIRAPFDGKLGIVLLSPGAYVAPGANVVTLTQMNPVYAEFALPESDLDLARAALANGQLTIAATPMLAADGSAPASGPIVFIDNAVDPASATFKLRARVDNGDRRLWPGQSITVGVHAGDRGGLVLVPAVAVQPQDDGSICYVVKPDQTIEVRKVEVALNVGETAGIASGLQPGEQVVVEGQSTLTAGTAVTLAKDKPKADVAVPIAEAGTQP